jgi:hypothetical protein
MAYTDEEFDKVFDTLPEDVKEAMTAVNTINIMMGLKTKYNLHIDQLGELSAEVGTLMLGATHPQEFIGKVETGLRIPRETAKLIATEVNEKIFRPVRESLMQIHKMREAEGVRGSTEDVPAVPLGEISQSYDIKDNVKNEKEETHSMRTETKNITENTAADNSILPQKPAVPDPYRETL